MNMNKRLAAGILAGMVGTGVAQAQLPPPVAEWNFDDQTLVNTGTSAGTHDGSVLGAQGFGYTNDTATGSGYALDLSLMTNVLVIGESASGDAGYADTFDAPAAFSYSMWVKSTDGVWTQWAEFGGKGSEGSSIGWGMRARYFATHAKDGTQISFYGGRSAKDGQPYVNVIDQEWHLLTFTYDGASQELNLYIDGLLEASATSALTVADAQSLVFGARSETERWEQMLIDDIKFFDEALSAEQVGLLAGGFFNVAPEQLDLFLITPNTTVTGQLELAYASEDALDVSVSITDQTHANAFTVVGDNPRSLVSSPEVLEMMFNNEVANLTAGQTATGLVTIAWYPTNGSGETNEVFVPISVINGYLPGQENIFAGTVDSSWGSAGNWDQGRVPGVEAADVAIIQDARTVNYSSGLTTYFDWQTIVRGGATLNIGADFLANGHLAVGQSTDSGFVNQTAGLSIFSTISNGVDSVYTIAGGSVTSEFVNLESGAVIDVDGGSFVIHDTDSDADLKGTGLLKVQSGEFGFSSAANYTTMFPDIEISGGAVTLGNIARFRGEFKVIGDRATINAQGISSHNSANSVDFVFEMGESGITPINASGAVNLSYASITVDGASYTGGEGVFPLLDGGSLILSSDLTVTNFDAVGMDVTIFQDTNNIAVYLIIGNGGYGEWAAGYGLSGADSAPDYDYDLDTHDNFLEYALGGDPTDPADMGLLENAVVEDEGTPYYEYVYGRRIGSEGELNYSLYYGSDLVFTNWSTAEVVELPITGALSNNYEAVTNRVDMTDKPVGFFNLEVEKL